MARGAFDGRPLVVLVLFALVDGFGLGFGCRVRGNSVDNGDRVVGAVVGWGNKIEGAVTDDVALFPLANYHDEVSVFIALGEPRGFGR